MFFLTGLIGMNLVSEQRLERSAIEFRGSAAVEPSAVTTPPQALASIAPPLAKVDVTAGEATAKKLCTACYTFTQGGKVGIGPNLYGIVGATHDPMEGFNYSTGMKAKQGPWTLSELNEWLRKPSAFIPGTRLAFAGIGNDQQRADVIAYLSSLSATPEPLQRP